MMTFLVSIVRIKPITHCGVKTQSIACHCDTNSDCLCLGRTLKMSGLACKSWTLSRKVQHHKI